MAKRTEPILFKAFLFLALFLLAEAGTLMFLNNPGSITGHSIGDLSDVYSKFYPNSKNFLIVQWSIIAVLIVFVYLKNSKIHRRNRKVSKIDVDSAIKGSKTNLDALYVILKKEKSLDLKTVANLFEIEIDLAMEWARVLESGDLVTIDYPGIGSPMIKLVEEENKEEKEKKEGEKVAPTVLLKPNTPHGYKKSKITPIKVKPVSKKPVKKLEKKKQKRKGMVKSKKVSKKKITRKKKTQQKKSTPKKKVKKSKKKK